MRLAAVPTSCSSLGRPLRMQDGLPGILAKAQKTAYVGQSVPLAGEYHDCDFDWDEHKAWASQIVARQEEEARKLCSTSSARHGSSSTRLHAGDTTAHAPPAGQEQVQQKQQERKERQQPVFEGEKWEEFYQLHGQAKFYKLRRYLLLEFPALARQEPAHVMEIGCGCGSSILPVLTANPQARFTVTDVSATCIQQLKAAAASLGVAATPDKIASFVCDSTDPAVAGMFRGLGCDYLLIMFTLSAVTPEQQHEMLSNAFRALRPGGLMMLRDHGLYDMVQLRIPPEQWVGPNMYKRGDGTLAFFFTVEGLSAAAQRAGFKVDECKYITVINRNKKSGVELKRVFIHCVLRKPLDSAAEDEPF